MADPGFGIGRAPCGGWPASPNTAVGSCYQHQRRSDDGKQFYSNVTKMTDVAAGTSGGITIIPRRSNSDLPACAGAPSACKTAYDPMAPGGELCDSWRLGNEAPQNVPSANTVDYNAYELVPATLVNYSKCRMLGFKNVQAGRYFNGRLGFNSSDWQPNTGGIWDSTHNQLLGGMCICRGELPAADQTKYLIAEVAVSMTQTPAGQWGGGDGMGGTIPAVNAYLNATLNCDNQSGINTITGCSQDLGSGGSPLASDNHPVGPYWTSFTIPQFLSIANWNIADLVNRFWQFYQVAQATDSGFTTSSSGGVWSLTETSTGRVWEEVANDFASSFRRTIFGYHLDGTQYKVYEETVTITATGLHFTETDIIVPDAAHPADRLTVVTTVDVTLSGSHTAADIEGDSETLLAQWDMGDSAKYPWRLDSYVGIAPLVTRNETANALLFTSDMICGYTDPLAADFNGGIKGATNPAGYDGHFDFNHRTTMCCISGGGPPGYYIGERGAKSNQINSGDSTDIVVPASATQWTENGAPTDPFGGGNLPPGGWIIWNGSQVRAQKWAEIKLPWKSYNYARPYGEDRFLFDEPTVRCVDTFVSGDGSGGSPYSIVVVSTPSASPVLTGDKVIYCGGSDNPTVTALCTSTKVDATHFTLVKIMDAPPRTDCGTGIFGKVRWPSAPATATDPTWDDDQSKGDFISLEFAFNYRDYAERDLAITTAASCTACTAGGSALRVNQAANGMPREVSAITQTTRCLAFTVCDPQVMCFSPNTESFNNALVVGLTKPGCDLVYGSRWQGTFVQQWPDLLWQTPHVPCEFDGASNGPTACHWNEDDGTCQMDSCAFGYGDAYFAHRPLREASNLIVGTPALPAGIYKNFLTWDQLQSATPPDGFTVPPPVGAGYADCSGTVAINLLTMPWITYVNEYLCVCGLGVFADTYAKEGAKVKCP